MKVFQWIAAVMLSVSLILIMFITSFETAMYADYDFYRDEYEKYDVLSELNMEMEDVMHVTKEMMQYLIGRRETLSVIVNIDGQQQDFFNEQDRFHMGEVRSLFLGGLALRNGGIIVLIICFLLLIMTKANIKKILPKAFWIALGGTGVVTAILAYLFERDFTAAFTVFHQLFFDNNLWMFDPAEDYMIRMLPEGFFADIAVRIVTFFLICITILLLLSIFANRFMNKNKGKKQID